MTALQIGDRSTDGLLEIADTSWDFNGTLRVTVRELIGGKCWDRSMTPLDAQGFPLEKARRFARRTLMYPERTRSARVVSRHTSDGCDLVTFAVSRND